MTVTSVPIRHPRWSKRGRVTAAMSGIAGLVIGISTTAVLIDQAEPDTRVTAPAAVPPAAAPLPPGEGLPATADAAERWLADVQRRLIEACTSAPTSADALAHCMSVR